MAKNRFFILCLLACLLLPCMVWGLDFTLRPRPYLFIPTGTQSRSRFGVGGGADINLDLDISTIFTNPLGIGYGAGLEGGFLLAPAAAGPEFAQFYSAGAAATVFYYPISRLLVRLDGGLGYYQAGFNGLTDGSLWGRGGLEVGFRFSPVVTLSGAFGYRGYENGHGSGSLAQGVYAGLTVQIVLGTGSRDAGVSLSVMQDDPVIPLFLSLYQESPAASLFITNEEPAEIRDVRVSFTAGEFTTSEFICGIIPLIAKGHTMELPLLADFSPDLLNFTENGRVVGELTIRYTLLGQERRTVKSAAVDIYRRNSFRWIDPAGAAAFVSPTAPEILEYAKLVTSLSNSRRRTGLNGPMQNALALFEGLLAAGFRCTPDVTTPYREFRIDPEKVDSIQFPFETLRYRSGDVDDIGVLLAEALEAAGVHTAFISLEDDFIVALSLNTTEAGASAFFNNNAKLVIAGDRAWMPLAMSAFNGGFINSWEAGAAAVDRHIKAGKDFNFVTLEDAWRSYPPLAPPSQGVRPPVPAEAAMNAAIDQALRRYTASELTPKITQINAQIQQGATGALYNQLGTAYLRCAMLREARDAFERAARLNYAPGMNNRGNLALMDKDLAAAERWFNQALAVDAENAAALRGLQQVKNQRDD